MADQLTCPHCTHLWKDHYGAYCHCGCMWPEPKPPEPPKPPPTERELLAQRVLCAICDELDHQAEVGSLYWDREWGTIDGEPVWDEVALAVVDAFMGLADQLTEGDGG